jgi:hypothetical protein
LKREKGSRKLLPERHSKIEWKDSADLSDDIMDYQLHALKGILAGETYSELGWDIAKTE